MSPDLTALRAKILDAWNSPNPYIRANEIFPLLDYTEALIDALREARKCVSGCDWSDVEDLVPADRAHELEPHDGNHLLERIDALLPPEPQR